MNPSQNFSSLYTDVSESIAAALADIEELNVEHQDGKKELDSMMGKLRDIKASFDKELDTLDKHAEWDKFTMAFFGETNAGKSTIIESLRILFKEESRQQLLQQNEHDLVKFEQALAEHVNQVRDGLNRAYAEHAKEFAGIRQSAAALAQVLREESSSRIRRRIWLSAGGGAVIGAALAVALMLTTGLT